MNYNKMMRFAILKSMKPQNVNKILIHSRNETIYHFYVKPLLAFLIFRQGDGVMTEVEFSNGRVVDVVQVKNESGNVIGYEVESNKNTKDDIDDIDLVEIPLKKIPTEVLADVDSLSSYLQNYIV